MKNYEWLIKEGYGFKDITTEEHADHEWRILKRRETNDG